MMQCDICDVMFAVSGIIFVEYLTIWARDGRHVECHRFLYTSTAHLYFNINDSPVRLQFTRDLTMKINK